MRQLDRPRPDRDIHPRESDPQRTSGGDQRRLADLFGLSIDAAARSTATLDHPDLARL